MNRRMFFALLKNPPVKTALSVQAQLDEILNFWTNATYEETERGVWKYKVLDFKSQVA